MRQIIKKLSIILFLAVIGISAKSQFGTLNGPFTTGIPCGTNCTNINFKVPNFKTTEDYVIKEFPFSPFQYIVPNGFEEAQLYTDDKYSDKYDIGFQFCFFAQWFPKMVVGSNGIVTFDTTNANCANNYQVGATTSIPSAGGTQCAVSGGAYIARASILSPYHDLHPTTTPNPADRKIQWRIEGTAPHRRFVISYFNLPHYTNTACLAALNTSQIVLHESTGIIDIHVRQKGTCASPGTNGGRAIFGIQDFTATKAVTDPAKNPGIWSENSKTYKFIPNGMTNLIKNVRLKRKDGTVVGTATLGALTGDSIDVSYNNYCLSASGPDTLVIDASYESPCTGTTMTEFSLIDTIYIIKNPSDLLATATSTPATCIAANGSITVTVPAAAGAGPFLYSLNGGVFQNSPTFNNLANGAYTVSVKNLSGVCTSNLTVQVGFTNPLMGSAVTTPPTCAGASNGTAVLTGSNGATPYQYSQGTGAYQASNMFTGLAAGSYSFNIKDANGCVRAVFVIVPPGSGSLTATISTGLTSCPGAANGSITVTAPDGMAPHTFSINNGAFQNSNVFNNLAAGTYTVSFKDANGCSGTYNIIVSNGAGITASAAITPTSCLGVSNGVVTLTANSGTAPYQYSLNGGANQASNVFNNLAAGMYTFRVTDFNGCFVNVTASVTNGAGFGANSNTIATTCMGVNNGSITITPVGGNAPFTYALNGGTAQPSNVFNNVSASNHTVLVTDNVGCTRTVMVTVGAGNGFTATLSTTPTTCTGVSNGSITVTPTGGNAPYTYSLNGGTLQNSNVFNNVGAGIQTVVITDNAGCTNTQPVTIIAGNGFTATTATVPTTCVGASNGSITVTPTGGNTPFTYSLNGAASQNSNMFNNVAAGMHTIVITDNAGCTNTQTVTILNGNGFTANATVALPTCATATNGSLSFVATGGAAPYTYSINGGIPQMSNQFNSIGVGMYNYTIKDANNCTTTGVVNVTAGAGITLNTASTNTSCSAVSDGTITVTATNGAGIYSYALNGGTPQPSNTFNNLAAGNYNITVTDGVGCVKNAIVNVSANTVFSLTQTTSAAACGTATNGSATITATGATGALTYALNGGTSQASNIFTGLAVGNYNVIVTNSSGCNNNISFAIVAGNGISATASSIATTCNGATDGSVTITPSNGITPYTYQLGTGTFGPNNTFTGLASGNFNFTVKDGNGCTTTVSAMVANGPNLSLTATTNPVLCDGGNNGSLTITATNGAGGYMFSVNGGIAQASPTFNNLTAGTYTLTANSVNGCSGTAMATVTAPAALVVNVAAFPVLCNGGNSGTLTTTVAGGVGPYSYSIDGGGNYQTNPLFSVAAGTYVVTVKDANGCIKTGNATVGQPTGMTAATMVTSASCNGGADGTIVVTVIGGSSPYTYAINGGAFQTNNVFNTIAGTYAITVKDANNCTTNTTAMVSLTSNLTLDTRTDTTICETQPVTLTTLSNATKFAWTPKLGLNDSTLQNPVATPLVTTKYYVTATLGGCSLIDSVTVIVRPAPTAFAGADGEVCFGQNYTLQGSGGVQYAWAPTSTLNNALIANPIATATATTKYWLHVIDMFGCKSLVPDTMTLAITPPLQAFAGNDSTIVLGQPYQLYATLVPLAMGTTVTYKWSPSMGLNNPNIQNPVATLQWHQTYAVEITTAAGCKGVDTVALQVLVGPNIFVPTSFTPNGDGVNDIFRVYTSGVKNLEFLRVFNRYGHLVFQTKNPSTGWDGTIRGKPAGTQAFIYHVRGIDENGKVIEKKGTLVIVR